MPKNLSIPENFTKKDIIHYVRAHTQLPQKQVQLLVQKTIDAIAHAFLLGRPVELRNFGVFELQVRKKRIGRNPNKPETDVIIPERTIIKFKAGKELKSALKHIRTQAE